mgnify:CR=1 FL=1
MPGSSFQTAPIATIDMGSNSYHLLVSQRCDGELQTISTMSCRVQTALLMEGDDLTDSAVKRAREALASFREHANYFGCRVVRAAATSALRRANNPEMLTVPAADILGVPIDIIDGAREAQLIYRGVIGSGRLPSGPCLVIDIGGGSTELIVGNGRHIEDLASLPLGCVTSLQYCFEGGELDRAAFDDCTARALAVLAPLAESFSAVDRETVACSGTALAVSAVLGTDNIALDRLYALRDRLLADFNRINEIRIDGLDANRALLLLPGLAILIAICETLGVRQVRVVDAALREGLALDYFKVQPPTEPQRGIAL